MWAAFLAERAGALGDRFGCATPARGARRAPPVRRRAALGADPPRRARLVSWRGHCRGERRTAGAGAGLRDAGTRRPAARGRGRGAALVPRPPRHLPRGRRQRHVLRRALRPRPRDPRAPRRAHRSRSRTSARATSSASWRCSTTSCARPRSRRSTTSQAIAVLGSDMRRLLREHPDIAVKLVIALGRRLREANERLARQSFQTVQSRVAVVLDGLVRQAQREGAGRQRRPRHDHAGRHRPARRLVARVGQPLPRGARARRRDHAGPGAHHRPRPRRACQLRLLSSRRAACVVRDGECVVIVPTRPAANGSKVLALPKGHPEEGESPATRRCARSARRRASRRGWSSSSATCATGTQRDGRRIAKVVELLPARPTSAARSTTTTTRSSRRAGWRSRRRRAS